MDSYYFDPSDGVLALSPLQVAEGAAQHLSKLSEADARAHLEPITIYTASTLKDVITQRRWKVETGGIKLSTGVDVATGIDDQNRITSVVANAERAGLLQVDFKKQDGTWIKVTLAELQSIASSVALHVQTCFSAERHHHEAIDALATLHQDDAQSLQTALSSYDVSAGWPETPSCSS